MDNFDTKILKVLQDDSRFNAKQVGDMVGLAEDETQKRIDALEESGVIAKYTALCNTEKLSEDIVTALIEVKVTPQMSSGFDAIARAVYQFEEVKALYLMSGAYDLAVIVQGKSLRNVSRFVSEKISTYDTVISTATHFILKKYKVEGAIMRKNNTPERLSIQA